MPLGPVPPCRRCCSYSTSVCILCLACALASRHTLFSSYRWVLACTSHPVPIPLIALLQWILASLQVQLLHWILYRHSSHASCIDAGVKAQADAALKGLDPDSSCMLYGGFWHSWSTSARGAEQHRWVFRLTGCPEHQAHMERRRDLHSKQSDVLAFDSNRSGENGSAAHRAWGGAAVASGMA